MLWTILGLIVIGLIAGLIARAVIPGKQSIGILMTIVLGIVGSFVGGFLGFLIFGATRTAASSSPPASSARSSARSSCWASTSCSRVVAALGRRNAKHTSSSCHGTGPAQLRQERGWSLTAVQSTAPAVERRLATLRLSTGSDVSARLGTSTRRTRMTPGRSARGPAGRHR